MRFHLRRSLIILALLTLVSASLCGARRAVASEGHLTSEFRARVAGLRVVDLKTGRKGPGGEFGLGLNTAALIVASEGCTACEDWFKKLQECRPKQVSVIVVGHSRYARQKLRELKWAQGVYWLARSEESKLMLNATPFSSVREVMRDGSVQFSEAIGPRPLSSLCESSK